MASRLEECDSDCAVKMDFDQELSELEYRRQLGAYRPHFQGVPQEYYPASWPEVVGCVMLLLFIVCGGLGAMIGLLLWDSSCGSSVFVRIWSYVFLGFTGVLIVAIFFGGRVKIANQRKVIHEKLNVLQTNKTLISHTD